ncbi:MAG: hypothetical protein ACOC1O_06000 [bacterium]
MKSGESFSEKDYQRGDKYVDRVISRIHKAGVNAEKNPRAKTYQQRLEDAKYGDIKIFYGNGNKTNAEVKSSMWVPYNETMITEVDIYIFKYGDNDFVCTDVGFIKNKLKKEESKLNLSTSRGTEGTKKDYEKDHRVEDPKQPKKKRADLGYRLGLNEFPPNTLLKLERYLQDPSFH